MPTLIPGNPRSLAKLHTDRLRLKSLLSQNPTLSNLACADRLGVPPAYVLLDRRALGIPDASEAKRRLKQKEAGKVITKNYRKGQLGVDKYPNLSVFSI